MLNIDLKRLYQHLSKHSNYQTLSDSLTPLINRNDLRINSRYEKERMSFLKEHINFKGKKVIDIGGNTGYFSFESINAGASEIDYFEGNKEHAEFVRHAAYALGVRINIFNKYINFKHDQEIPNNADIILFFNVLHHLGDDFGDSALSLEEAKIKMKESLKSFRNKADTLVIQMGFCWKGNRDLLLFKNGTKEEMIAFINNAIEGQWVIESIGIAEEHNGVTKYKKPNKINIQRNDKLGEFRNRPIFILKSKV